MCLGPTHTMWGLVAGVATLPIAPVPHDPMNQIGWVACCGGAALIPDLDFAKVREDGGVAGAELGEMWGLPTEGLALAVAWVARGHRWGTHDVVLGPLAFWLAAVLLSTWWPTRLLVMALVFGAALRACHFVIPGRAEFTIGGNLAMSFAAAAAVTHFGGPAAAGWLPAAVFVGALAHLAADFPTVAGLPVPLYWMWRRRHAEQGARRRWWSDGRMELPSWKYDAWWCPPVRVGAFATGHVFERYIVFPAACLTLAVLVAHQTGVLAAAQHALHA